MIVDRRAGIARLLTESVRPLLALFAWDIIVVLLFQLAHRDWMDQPALPYSLIGSALVLFLSVRNTTAYARWWEARTLWGGVVNNTRSFSRQMATLLGGAPELTRAMIAYAHALRGGLAGMVFQEPMTSLNPLHRIGRQVAEAIRLHQNIARPALRPAAGVIPRMQIGGQSHWFAAYLAELLHRTFERQHRLQGAHVADVPGHVCACAVGETEGILQFPAHSQYGRAILSEVDR